MAELSSVAIVLTGYTVLGLAGFGSALTIVPLLAWKWPLPEVVTLVLLLDLPATLMHSGMNWRRMEMAELRRLLPGILVGTVVGLWLTRHVESHWPLLALGLYVTGMGFALFRAGSQLATIQGRWAVVFGLGIGVVEMVFGTAGPLIVTWLSRRIPDPEKVRASIPMVLTVVVLIVLVGMASEGRLSSISLWQSWSTLLLPALGGVWLGHKLSRFVPAARLRQLICLLLICSGLALVRKALS